MILQKIFIIFFTIYTASGFVACAKLFNSVFDLNYHVGLLIGLVVILAYTILGGYLAVCSFFVLSGYLSSVTNFEKDKFSFKSYYYSK